MLMIADELIDLIDATNALIKAKADCTSADYDRHMHLQDKFADVEAAEHRFLDAIRYALEKTS